jgi:hypothetical protein
MSMSGELAFSTAELAEMRTAQQAHMMDTAVVQTFSASTADSWGIPADSYSDGSAVYCGFNNKAGIETQGEGEVVQYDATVRLPIGTAVTESDRIKITKRHGTTLSTPLIFEIVRLRRGPSGLLLELEQVTDGS